MENNLETVKVILEISGEQKTFWLSIGNPEERNKFESELDSFIKANSLFKEKTL